MKGQWSIAFALVALAIVAWAITAVYLASPKYMPLDTSEELYLLKLSAVHAIQQIYCTTYSTSGLSVYCDGRPLFFGPNESAIVFYDGRPVAARLSAASGAVNYTLFVALQASVPAVSQTGQSVRAAYFSVYSTLDFLPELQVNATHVEYVYLRPNGWYYQPSLTYLLVVENGTGVRIVDYPVVLNLSIVG